ADLQRFVGHVASSKTGLKRDWSRFDLNGDGFTGGLHVTEFDLDRTGSQRAGPTVLGTVDLLGAPYDETFATDQDVLCYYAYSPLYTGSKNRRRQLLDPQKKCGIPPPHPTCIQVT